VPPPFRRHVIDGRLDDSIRSANEIRLLRANRNGEALFPVRLDGVTEDGARICVRREFVGSRKPGAKCASDEAGDGLQEVSAR
jgi:hypothetical protein